MPGSCTTIRLCPWRVISGQHAGFRRYGADDLIDWSHRPGRAPRRGRGDKVSVMVSVGSEPDPPCPAARSKRPTDQRLQRGNARIGLRGVGAVSADPVLVRLGSRVWGRILAAAQGLATPSARLSRRSFSTAFIIDLQQQIAAAP